jgi:glutamyl-tRNA synthetase
MRAEQTAAGENPRYDGRCRERHEPREGVEPVVRFKTPREGEVVVNDLVHGRVAFSNAELDDLVILRSDGWPTYHFSVIIDDADMGITHVIRGDDHLNNTPRQINMIKALGLPLPQYAHLPMILGEDGARLSKRHGAVNVLEYRDRGYLPEAVLNYLVRLGWSHGDQEIFNIAQMTDLFDIKDVNAAASRFNPEKLTWLNQQYIQSAAARQLAPLLEDQLSRQGLDPGQGPAPDAVVEAYKERAETMEVMAESAWYLYRDFEQADEKAAKKHLRPVIKPALADLRQRLDALESWGRELIHAAIEAVAEQHGLKFGKLGQPLRVAVTGGSVSPPIDVTTELVGRERSLARIDLALAYITAREAA